MDDELRLEERRDVGVVLARVKEKRDKEKRDIALLPHAQAENKGRQ
jgi:hypothetical protein